MTYGTCDIARARKPVARHARVTLVASAVALAGIAVGGFSATASAASHERGVAGASCVRPYTDESPWNTPIGESPVYAFDSVARISQINGALSSDPSQFTYPVYKAAKSRKATKVKISQALSQIRGGGASLLNQKRGTLRILCRRARAGPKRPASSSSSIRPPGASGECSVSIGRAKAGQRSSATDSRRGPTAFPVSVPTAPVSRAVRAPRTLPALCVPARSPRGGLSTPSPSPTTRRALPTSHRYAEPTERMGRAAPSRSVRASSSIQPSRRRPSAVRAANADV